MLADLADDGKLGGAHLTVYRHPRPKVGVELRLDEAEQFSRKRGPQIGQLPDPDLQNATDDPS